MNKKMLIVSTIVILVAVITGVIFAVLMLKHKDNGNDNNRKFDSKVAYVFTIDVNPSLEVSLNKKNEVIDVKPIDEDGSTIIQDIDFQGKTIEDTLNIIVDNLKENNYLTEETNTILINVVSGNKGLSESIKSNLEKVTSSKNLTTEIMMLEISETEELKVLAEKYNMTIGKAYYITENIKKEDVSIEDLKDASIEHIKEVIEEQKQEDSPKQDNNPSNSNQGNLSPAPNLSGGCNPPSSATENIAAWCRFNKSRPQNCEFYYPDMLDSNTINNMALSHLGITAWDTISNYQSQINDDSRSSYCISKISEIVTREKKTTLIFDSVTGEIISESSEAIPAPSISEADAVNIALGNFGLNEADCQMCHATFSADGSGSDNFYYRYNVGILMQSGEQHVVDVNPYTGAIIKVVY